MKKSEIVNILRNSVSENHFVDVGPGSEKNFDAKTISWNAAIRELIDAKTHVIHHVIFPIDLGNIIVGASVLVLAPIGTSKDDILQHRDWIYPAKP